MEDKTSETVMILLKPPTGEELQAFEEQGWQLGVRAAELCLVRTPEEAPLNLVENAGGGLSDAPMSAKDHLEAPLSPSSGFLPPPAEKADGQDVFLFGRLQDPLKSSELAAGILRHKYGLAPGQIEFQTQRVKLMEAAVAASIEVNGHLQSWRRLSYWVAPLLALTTAAAFFILWRMLKLVEGKQLDGWQLVVLIFVLALMAVSPATLLLIGRPLQGLDAWSPGKVDKDADPDDKAGKENKEPADGKDKKTDAGAASAPG